MPLHSKPAPCIHIVRSSENRHRNKWWRQEDGGKQHKLFLTLFPHSFLVLSHSWHFCSHVVSLITALYYLDTWKRPFGSLLPRNTLKLCYLSFLAKPKWLSQRMSVYEAKCWVPAINPTKTSSEHPIVAQWVPQIILITGFLSTHLQRYTHFAVTQFNTVGIVLH